MPNPNLPPPLQARSLQLDAHVPTPRFGGDDDPNSAQDHREMERESEFPSPEGIDKESFD